MAKLGDVTLHVEKEEFRDAVQATGYAVERGEPFTDHVESLPLEMTLSAHLLGSGHSTRLSKLRNYQKKGTFLKFVGRSTAYDVIILGINGVYESSIGNGLSLMITIRRVRVAKSPWVKVPPKQKPIQKPPSRGGTKKPVASKPRPTTAKYHVTRKNDTYWALSRKYGTSIPQLRAWNRYPDKQIPINIKLRVK